MANIANDPLVELQPQLSWEVNVLASQQLAEKASRMGVKNFIFASSGSVYGISDKEKVTEENELLPISEYNKTKMVAERIFLSYRDKMNIFCVRPATVCGVSPRMRLDVSVNILIIQLYQKELLPYLEVIKLDPTFTLMIFVICTFSLSIITEIFNQVSIMQGLKIYQLFK